MNDTDWGRGDAGPRLSRNALSYISTSRSSRVEWPSPHPHPLWASGYTLKQSTEARTLVPLLGPGTKRY